MPTSPAWRTAQKGEANFSDLANWSAVSFRDWHPGWTTIFK
jgi:hypothetical protein